MKILLFLILAMITNCANKKQTDSFLLNLLLFSATMNQCGYTTTTTGNNPSFNPTISEGVWGTVWFLEGNFMPTVTSSYTCSTETYSRSSVSRVVRKIYFYEPTKSTEVVSHTFPTFYTQIQTQLLSQTESDANGFFQISLPVGEYSIFILEKVDGKEYYYANSFDGQGRIQTATVLMNQKLQKDIFINYNASY